MANCKNKKLIGPYLDGQLSESLWLDEHIGECPECLAEYENIQRINHLAHKNDFAPPESNYWNHFHTRVSARIAARQRPRLYTRILESILSVKLFVRISAVAVVIIIGVVIFKIDSFMGDILYSREDKVVTTSEITADNDIYNISDRVELPIPISENEIIPVTQDDQKPDGLNLTVQNKKVQELKNEYVEIDRVDNELKVKEYSVQDLRTSTSSLNKRGDVTLSYSALTEAAVMHSVNGLSVVGFDTDKVIRYQIFSGSNSSLVPLSSHREATGKYFAPERSLSRDIYNQSISSNWGYATRSGNFDQDRLRHLKLELKLSREK